MDKKPHQGDSQPTGAASSSSVSAMAIVGTMADTTWRIFVPTVGLMLLGVWADRTCGTKPWLMIIGLAIGVACAVALVRRQIRGAARW